MVTNPGMIAVTRPNWSTEAIPDDNETNSRAGVTLIGKLVDRRRVVPTAILAVAGETTRIGAVVMTVTGVPTAATVGKNLSSHETAGVRASVSRSLEYLGIPRMQDRFHAEGCVV